MTGAGVIRNESSEHTLRALMCAGLDGDAEAHRRLLLDLSGRLRGYFRSRLRQFNRGPVDAEDLVQDVLFAVHTRRDTYDRAQPFTPWLYGIARYKFLDYLRQTKACVADVPVDGAEQLIAQNDVNGVESAYDLESLLATLQPKARRAIRYMKLQGLSVRETATRTGMSESAVKVSTHRGLKALSALVRRAACEACDARADLAFHITCRRVLCIELLRKRLIGAIGGAAASNWSTTALRSAP